MTDRAPGWFDAVLIVAFGGPQGRADIRPFLERVLRGRRVTPERIEGVAHHYELFDGVSPITELTRQQAKGLEGRLAAAGFPLHVYVGMRNWHPFLADTLKVMHGAGIRRVVGFMAPALLAGLIVVELGGDGVRGLDWAQIAGVAVAGIAWRLRAPMLLAVLLGALSAAALRLL